MNWDAIGAVGEILGAIAVFVSLIYLAIQIKSNTKEMKTRSVWDAHHTFAGVNDYLAQGGQISEIVIKSMDPATSSSDFSTVENFQIHTFARSMFQRLEAQYFLYKAGTLEPEIWENRKLFNRGLLDLPVYRDWWELEVNNAQYTQEFIDEINNANRGQVLFVGQNQNPADA